MMRGAYTAKREWTDIGLLKNITLSVKEGDRIALVGANGAGKTSLLYMLGGNYHPQTGMITRQGKIFPIYNLKVGFKGDSTGYENIYLRGLLMGMSLQEIGTQRDEIIAFSELEDHIYKPLNTYSSGMKMRLAFAITMCLEPDVLLMDEWFSVGDKAFKAKAQARLKDFMKKASALVLATHSEALVRAQCNKALVLKDGEIVQEIDVHAGFTIPDL